MAPVVYHRDLNTASRLKQLELRMDRLENGSLLKAKSVIFQAELALVGPWPASSTFAVNNARSSILVIWSASMFSTLSGGTYTILLNVDAVLKDTITVAGTATASSHFTAPASATVMTGLTAASHTIQVALGSGNSNSADFANVTVLELPQ